MNLVKVSGDVAFFFFFILISCGNLLRCVDGLIHVNNFLLTELFLYLACFAYFFIAGLYRQLFLKTTLLCGYLGISFMYGCFTSGFDVMAFLYVLRTMGMLYAGAALGHIAMSKFQYNPYYFLSWLLRSYLVALAFSGVIYVTFPESAVFWEFLKAYHIKFSGDPHVMRFISVYFDPNFYGAIGCLPFMISYFLFVSTGKKRYFLIASLFAVAIILTQSRSGIVLFLLLLSFISIFYFNNGIVLSFKNRNRMYVGLGLLGMVMALLFRYGLLGKIVERLSSVSDPSAGFRFQSLRLGLETIVQAPLLGIGYNFIPARDLWIDSSLFVFAICCGILATICLLIICALFLKMLYAKWAKTEYRLLIAYFCAYVAIAVLFFSFFNQIVCYPFWLIPVLAIYHFFSLLSVMAKVRG